MEGLELISVLYLKVEIRFFIIFNYIQMDHYFVLFEKQNVKS